LIYIWYCLVQTYRQSGLGSTCPQIAISEKIINALIGHLSQTDDSRISNPKVAKACLRKLKDDHQLNYCLEIGVKTINLTMNLNPRSQAEKMDAQDLENDMEMRATQVFLHDK